MLAAKEHAQAQQEMLLSVKNEEVGGRTSEGREDEQSGEEEDGSDKTT